MYKMNGQSHIGPNKQPEHEVQFTEVVREFGGIALLDFFNNAELNGEGSVASTNPDEMRSVAYGIDGIVHVQYERGERFNLPYSRARELTVVVAREERSQEQN